MKLSKKELLKSPERKWDDSSRLYESVLLVPANTKHESGFMHIAVIGVYTEDKIEKYEICAYPDDISCFFPIVNYVNEDTYRFALVRMDCYYPSGILRYHGNGKFHVSEALSSIDITFYENERKNS